MNDIFEFLINQLEAHTELWRKSDPNFKMNFKRLKGFIEIRGSLLNSFTEGKNIPIRFKVHQTAVSRG